MRQGLLHCSLPVLRAAVGSWRGEPHDGLGLRGAASQRRAAAARARAGPREPHARAGPPRDRGAKVRGAGGVHRLRCGRGSAASGRRAVLEQHTAAAAANGAAARNVRGHDRRLPGRRRGAQHHAWRHQSRAARRRDARAVCTDGRGDQSGQLGRAVRQRARPRRGHRMRGLAARRRLHHPSTRHTHFPRGGSPISAVPLRSTPPQYPSALPIGWLLSRPPLHPLCLPSAPLLTRRPPCRPRLACPCLA